MPHGYCAVLRMTSIYLVRHGDYDYRERAPESVGQGLSARGKQQARLTGVWLASTNRRIQNIQSSDFTRASETASILAKALPQASVELDPVLRECPDIYFKEAPRVTQSAAMTFNQLFGPTATHPTPVVIVCHANLIRYLLSRLLEWTREKWESVLIGNCSVSIVDWDASAKTQYRVRAVAELQHLPQELRDNY